MKFILKLILLLLLLVITSGVVFGDAFATIYLDQETYTWTDKVYITVLLPEQNKNPNIKEFLGDDFDEKVTISTSKTLLPYTLVEENPDSGIFIGTVTLTGFSDHDANGDGIRNDARGIMGGQSPHGGLLVTSQDDQITISISIGNNVDVKSSTIRWNIAEVQWLEAGYSGSDTAIIRLIDPDMNFNPDVVDNFDVHVWSESNPLKSTKVQVIETGWATGIFEGSLNFVQGKSYYNNLNAVKGDTITVGYADRTLPLPYTLNDSIPINPITTLTSNPESSSPSKVIEGRGESTNLILKHRQDFTTGEIIVMVELNSESTSKIKTQIELFDDNNQKIGSGKSHSWIKIVNPGIDQYSITAWFDGGIVGTTLYSASSDTITIDSVTKQVSVSKTSSEQFREEVFKIKSKHSEILRDLESGLKLSKEILSESTFKNTGAIKLKESAFGLVYLTGESISEGKDTLEQVDLHLHNQLNQKGWDTLHELDLEMSKTKNDILEITHKIKESKKLEDEFQEKNKSCFLFWCFPVDTNKGLDLKIKDLELKIEKIKNKQKDIEITYQSETQNQKYQSTLEQDKLLNEKEFESQFVENEQRKIDEQRKLDIIDFQKQQNLEDGLEYEEQLRQQEQKRLQDQREYEIKLRQQEIQAEQERQRLEEQKQRELAEQKYQAEQERQTLELQKLIEEEKGKILSSAQTYPLVKGWIQGKLSYYVPPMPNYISQNVKDSVENLASGMDGKYVNGVKLERSYSEYADITINWVKDYQGEVIGRQVHDYLIVGLGSTSCDGEWKPYDGTTIYRLMYHEMGHALGQNHNSDPDNVMYKSIKNAKFEYDVKKSITLIDRNVLGFSICRDGTYSFVTEKTGTTNGYKTYLIPRGVNAWDVINGNEGFYGDCSSYENEMRSTSNQCYAPAGSIFVLYNPSVFGKGSDIPIDVKITNISSAGEVDYSFDKDDRLFSDDYLGRIKLLFRS